MPEEFDAYRKWLGIPPEDQPPHAYRLLGIAPFEDDPDVIQNAADRQMAHVRNYQAGKHGRLAQQILNELSTARVCLLNPTKKAAYDAEFRARLSGVTDVEIVDSQPTPPAAPPLPITGAQPEEASVRPAVNVAIGPTTKTVRPGSAARFSKSKRRSSFLPILMLVVCVLALVGAIAIVMNFDKFKTTTEAHTGSGKSRPGETKPGKQDKEGSGKSTKPDKPERTNPDKPLTKPPSDDRLFKPAPIIPPKPPVQDLSKGAREANLRKALTDARHALEIRQSDAARRFLIDADSFKANQEEADEIKHLRTLSTYLDSFWHAVRQGIHNLKPGDKFEFRRVQIEFQKVERETISFKIDGLEQELKIHDLDAKAAFAIASRSLKPNDPITPIYLSAFLALDNQGGRKQTEWQANMAKQFWHAAARRGEKNPYLAKELKIDMGAKPEPGEGEDASAEGAPRK